MKALSLCLVILLISACTATPPKQTDDICAIFKEKSGWYKAAKKSSDKWGSSIPTMMAMIHQESRFVADAKTPRTYYLGFIPGPRKSTAYGYPQAKDETWHVYQRSTGRFGDDRDDFGDAMYFVGWYNHQSYLRNKVPKWNTELLYLNYHEGHGGYARASYANKPWLKKVAKKVAAQNWRYRKQLKTCEVELQKSGWFWW